MPSPADRYSSYDPKPPEDEGPGTTGYLALALAWLVPGLGHVLIGQKARGVIFAVTIHLLFALGLLLGGIRSINPSEQPIWTYTQFLAGWPMLVSNQMWKGFAREYLPAGSPKSAKEGEYEFKLQEYLRQLPANANRMEATAEFTKKFIAANPPFAFHPKVHDMGSVYCGIAGMLNLLVMFDVLLRVTGSAREDPTAARGKQKPAASQTPATPGDAGAAAGVGGNP